VATGVARRLDDLGTLFDTSIDEPGARRREGEEAVDPVRAAVDAQAGWSDVVPGPAAFVVNSMPCPPPLSFTSLAVETQSVLGPRERPGADSAAEDSECREVGRSTQRTASRARGVDAKGRRGMSAATAALPGGRGHDAHEKRRRPEAKTTMKPVPMSLLIRSSVRSSPPDGSSPDWCHRHLRSCRADIDGTNVNSTMQIPKVNRNESTSLHEQVAAEIRRRSPRERPPRGTRLPPAVDLAAVLGVNKNTVILALHILRDEGVLDFTRDAARASSALPSAAPSS